MKKKLCPIKKPNYFFLFSCMLAPWLAQANESTDSQLLELSLDELVNVKIQGASKYEQDSNKVAAAATVITREEIKTYGWRTLSDALNSLPGVFTTYDRQYTAIGIRGLGLPGDFNSRVLVNINGNRINEVTYDTALVGTAFPLDVDLIERIEYIPGPGGAVYGQNAMLAVVNVITRKGGNLNGTELATAYQDRQKTWNGRGTWGKKLENDVELLASVSGMNSQGEDLTFDFPGAAISRGRASGLDSDRAKSLYLRADYKSWTYDLTYSDRDKQDPTGGYFSDPLVSGQYQRDRALLTQLNYKDTLIPNKLDFAARAFYGKERYTSILSYTTPFYFTGTSEWWGGEMRFITSVIANHKLMAGLEYQNNERYNQTIEDRATPANNIKIPRSGYRIGVYLQDEWSLTDKLTATLGARVDRNNVIGTNTSPRLSLIWQPQKNTAFKALYGRAYRAPNAYERDYDDGLSIIANPSLQGEKIDTFELVADHQVSKDLTLRASIYQWNLDSAIGLVSTGGITQYQNTGDITAKGMELSAQKVWGGGTALRANITHQLAKYDNSGQELENSSNSMGRLNLSTPWHAVGLKVGYELQCNSSRKDVVGGTVGGYCLSNINLLSEGKLLKGLDLSVGIYNLFDKKYSHPAADTNWQRSLEQDGLSVRLKAVYGF